MSPGDEAVDPAAAARGLLLIAPPGPTPDLEAVLAIRACVGVLLDPAGDADLAAGVQGMCRAHEVALFAPDIDQALKLGADGVMLERAPDVGEARRRLGPGAVIGARAGVSRHAAMVAGEDGADFVAFGDLEHPVSERLLETVAWWSELFVLPALAFARPLDDAAAARLAAAGADFLAVPWPALGDDPAAAAGRLARAFEVAPASP